MGLTSIRRQDSWAGFWPEGGHGLHYGCKRMPLVV
jgi:hypothetical protein